MATAPGRRASRRAPTCWNTSAGDANGSYTDSGAPGTGQTNILSGGTGTGVVTNMIDGGGATNTPSRYYRVRVLLP